MLTDPREALAEQCSLINGLVGLAGLAQVVRALAGAGHRPAVPARAPDDFVHLLLAVASLGEAVGSLARSGVGAEEGTANPRGGAEARPPASASEQWLR